MEGYEYVDFCFRDMKHELVSALLSHVQIEESVHQFGQCVASQYSCRSCS